VNLCAEPGCDAFVVDAGDLCDTHDVDEWGVRHVDCDCAWSWADNDDVEVCAAHRKAFRQKYMGRAASSGS